MEPGSRDRTSETVLSLYSKTHLRRSQETDSANTSNSCLSIGCDHLRRSGSRRHTPHGVIAETHRRLSDQAILTRRQDRRVAPRAGFITACSARLAIYDETLAGFCALSVADYTAISTPLMVWVDGGRQDGIAIQLTTI